jgi:hypothetical protein
MTYIIKKAFCVFAIMMLFSLVAIPNLRTNGNVLVASAQTGFSDGFESGGFGSWSGVALTPGDNASVVQTNPYEGVYSAVFQTGPVSSGIRQECVYENVATSTVYARGYFYIANGLPLDDNWDRFALIAFGAEGTTLASFRVFRSGGVGRFNIIGYNGTNSFPTNSTDTVYPVMGRWYCIEFYAKIDGTAGEYRASINGVELLSITNVNTAVFGNVTKVYWGIASSINVQHTVQVYADNAQINNYYGPQIQSFAVIGSTTEEPALTNFYWLFGNQSISYSAVLPSGAQSSSDIGNSYGLVVWTRHGGYNPSVIIQFARTHVVITDIRDFCTILYPTLNSSLQDVNSNTVTYDVDWGNFRQGDLADIRNETGNNNQLTAVLATSLKSFNNITAISNFDSSRVASFFMNGTGVGSGFFVMDLDATTPKSDRNGIWHVFPAVKMVHDFPTGKYAEWMANGTNWWNLTWVYNRVNAFVTANSGIAKKMIIGKSVQGRDIVAVAIGNGTRNAIMDGAIHGNEKTGAFACLRTAELLINYYRTDPAWKVALSKFTVIIVPVLNPDGFAADSRYNANGVDLNGQFPSHGTPTQPEAFALMNLMGNYTPSVYINMHEGYYWYPSDMLYGNYETGAGKAQTISDMVYANESFTSLRHWGWFTDAGEHVWIGKVNAIYQGGKLGMAVSYASYKYHASCMLIETFVWSNAYGARQSLWALDYYPAVTIAFLQHHIGIQETSTSYPPWDVNQDGTVGIRDVVIAAVAFGSTIGSPNWNPLADINADGFVNIIDLRIVAAYFGEQYG